MNCIVYLKIIDKFEVEGIENIKQYNYYIFVANHPTLIDVVAIMSCIPLCNCIVKESLWQHAYLGSIVRAAGYIVNDYTAQLIKDYEDSFKAGRSLIIFP
jgi:1-acyl-sn-glycerol-3-phosphate acyltransferase